MIHPSSSQLHDKGKVPIPTPPANLPGHASPFLIGVGKPFTTPSQAGWTPQELESAYQLPSYDGGNGKLVATVVAYDAPNIESDLNTYRSSFGIASCTSTSGCFTKVAEDGSTNYPPATSAEWAAEATADVEMFSVACPSCRQAVVEANSTSISDLTAAVSEAVKLGASVVNMSWGTAEWSGETSFDSTFNAPGVTFLAAAGDCGTCATNWPAASPDVLSAGGTNLEQVSSSTNASGDLWSESGWSGTTSGCSTYESAPSWQRGTSCTSKAIPDVSADAGTAIAIYYNPPSGTVSAPSATPALTGNWTYGWQGAGGTSLSSPLAAALWALEGDPTALADGIGLDYYDTAFTAGAGSVNPLATCGSNVYCWALLTGLGSLRGPVPRPGGTSTTESFGQNAGEGGPKPCWSGDPVMCATGNLEESQTDVSIPGRGQNLQFDRTYNSLAAVGQSSPGPLGYGWSDNYDQSLAVNQITGDVTVTQADGTTTSFAPTAGGGYSAAGWVTASLVKNASGTYTYTLHNLDSYTFDSSGQLVSESDRNGYVTSLSYNASNQLASVTDQASRSLSFTYDTGGQIATVTDPGGRVWHYGYDSAGDLTSVTDPAGDTTSYGYDASHRMTSVTKPAGGVTTNVYDSSNRVVSQTDPNAHTTTYAYSSNASANTHSTTITDPKGYVETEVFNQYDQVISVKRGSGTPQAATWNYQYEPGTGELTDDTDPNGHTTVTTWDAAGNELSVIDPLGRATTSTYDAYGDVLTKTDPAGVTTTYTYSADHDLLSSSTPIGTQSATTTYAYSTSDPGDVVSETDPDGHTTTYGYDAYGDKVSTTDPLGNVNLSCFNVIGELTATVAPKGTAAGASCSSPAPAADTTYMTYDPDCRLTSSTDPLGRVTTTTYDADGNKATVTDANGNTTTYSYDAADELTVTKDAAGNLTTTTYDADGNKATVRNGAGDVTTYAYGDPALPTTATAVTDPLGNATSTSYDGAGNKLTTTDASGRTTTYGYDAADELTSVSYSDGTTPNVSYAYDADGRRTQMTDGTGTSTFWYDALGRMTAEQNGAGLSSTYAYDLDGNTISVGYPYSLDPPARDYVTRTFDADNRLVAVTDWLGNTSTFAYDADGNLVSEKLGNGVSSTQGFNGADQLTSITDAGSSGTLASFTYGRDQNGQVTTDTETGVPALVGSGSGVSQSFSYDPVNRLGADQLGTYGYDPANNLITMSDGATQQFNAGSELTKSTEAITPEFSTSTTSLVTTTSATTSTVTVSLPAKPTANDQLLVGVTEDAGQSASISGYTQVGSWTTGTGAKLQVFRLTATGSETSVPVVFGATNDSHPVAIVAADFRGVDPTNPIDVSGSVTASGATKLPLPSVTTSGPGEALLAFTGALNSATAASWSAPSAMTTVNGADTALASESLFEEPVPVPGATGTKTATFGGTATADTLAGAIVALRPAVVSYGYDAEGERTSTTSPQATTTTAYDQAGNLVTDGSESYAYNGDGLLQSKTASGQNAEQLVWDTTGSQPLLLSDNYLNYVYGPGNLPLEQIQFPQISLVAVSNVEPTTAPTKASSYSYSATLPATAQANDQILIAVTEDAGESASISGYNLLGNYSSGSGVRLEIFDRQATGGESGATIVYSTTSAADTHTSAVEMAIYRGTNPAGAVDATAGAFSASGATSVTVPSVTASAQGDRLVMLQGALDSASSSLGTSWTPPSPMSEENQMTSGVLVASGLADETLANAGATGPLTTTFQGSASVTTLAAAVVAFSPPEPTYYLHDQLGSTRLLTDQTGKVVGSYTYDSYGHVANESGNAQVLASNPLGFAGAYTDGPSGFVYLVNRFYDPVTGQFLTVDPQVALTGQPYGYASDNPVNDLDPLGLNDCGWFSWACDVGHVVSGGAKFVWKHKAPIATGLGLVALAAATGGLAIPEEAAAATILGGIESGTGVAASLLGGANGISELVNGNYGAGTIDTMLGLAGFGSLGAGLKGADTLGQGLDIGLGELGFLACGLGL